MGVPPTHRDEAAINGAQFGWKRLDPLELTCDLLELAYQSQRPPLDVPP